MNSVTIILREPAYASYHADMTITEPLPISYAVDSSPAGEMRLSVRDLSVLTRTLKGAAARWKTIGLALGFLDDELTIIQRKPLLIPEGDTGYFRDMLSRWLKWAPPNHRWPTLEVLAAALNEAGEECLAYDLKQQYLSQNGECCAHHFINRNVSLPQA